MGKKIIVLFAIATAPLVYSQTMTKEENILTPSQEAELKKKYEELSDSQKKQWDLIDSHKEIFLAERFVNIDFYGRVLDQYENPVPNVSVTVLLDTYSPIPSMFFSERKDILVKTDEQGCFEFHGTGEEISVSVHSQVGYERTVGLNQSKFKYGGMYGAKYTKHIPDKNNPVIFHVRKKEEQVPLISKFYFNNRFPFSRIFHVTSYFDLFQKDSSFIYFDELAQPINWWKENGFCPQFSITQTLIKNQDDEQIKKVEIHFYGGITFLFSEEDIFNNVFKMDSALECIGDRTFTFWVKRERDQKGKTMNYAFSKDEKDWLSTSMPGKEYKQLDRPNFWVKFPGKYYGRIYMTGICSFPEKDLDTETAQVGVQLELNSIAENRIFEPGGKAIWEKKNDKERKDLQQKILTHFINNAQPFPFDNLSNGEQ